MEYKQEIKQYKLEAIENFRQHLTELERNVIETSLRTSTEKNLSEIYIDYQERTLKLIEGKIKIDNEHLKQINIKNLELYKDLEPEKFKVIQERVIENHKNIILELKAKYEEDAILSRSNLKFKLAEKHGDNDLDVPAIDPADFFPEKMNTITLNFIIIIGLLLVILTLTYYYVLA